MVVGWDDGRIFMLIVPGVISLANQIRFLSEGGGGGVGGMLDFRAGIFVLIGCSGTGAVWYVCL